MKLLMVMAGPNGSGKSTIAEEERRSPCFPRLYINPDTIARRMGLAQNTADSLIPRDALHAADAIRKACIDSGESFAYEAITSLAYMQYAKTQGYIVELIFITTSDPEINQERGEKTRCKRQALHITRENRNQLCAEYEAACRRSANRK